MTEALPLPALNGRDPLGFLAALGLLRLLTHHTAHTVQLSFSDITAEAILHGPYTACTEVADTLAEIVTNMPDAVVIPDLPADFPLAKTGTKGSDPMRVPREDYPEMVGRTLKLGANALDWQAVIVTDLARDAKGCVALTPYSAPAGQQTVRSFFDKPISHVRADPAHLLHALTGWQRVPGFTGEYLDHRVLRSAADHPLGESSEIGVPGATWLAIMALPMLRLGGDGTTVTATLWRQLPKRRPLMIWPMWRQPLGLAAVTTLIEHPALAPVSNEGRISVPTDAWPALGVFAIGGAQRRPIEGRKSAGVLVPLVVDTDS